MGGATVAIVDTGGANIASLRFALERLGAGSRVTSDAADIAAADRVILPGVGAAADAMRRLRATRLDELLPTLQQPVLGICLGMQLLGAASEEDGADCLGIVPGTSAALPASPATPVPNMGWCRVRKRGSHALLAGVEDGSYFYFVHSFALPVDTHTLATADHAHPFAAVCARDNFLATQFHPERSAAAGARVLDNFLHFAP